MPCAVQARLDAKAWGTFFLAVAQEFPIDKKNRDAEVALSRIPEFKAVTKAS